MSCGSSHSKGGAQQQGWCNCGLPSGQRGNGHRPRVQLQLRSSSSTTTPFHSAMACGIPPHGPLPPSLACSNTSPSSSSPLPFRGPPTPRADYDMKDVERFHTDEAARRFHLPADEGQWDGEGKGACAWQAGWGAGRELGRGSAPGPASSVQQHDGWSMHLPCIFALRQAATLGLVPLLIPGCSLLCSHSYISMPSLLLHLLPLPHFSKALPHTSPLLPPASLTSPRSLSADYDMKDVERFAERAAKAAGGEQTVWNGEGPGANTAAMAGPAWPWLALNRLSMVCPKMGPCAIDHWRNAHRFPALPQPALPGPAWTCLANPGHAPNASFVATLPVPRFMANQLAPARLCH